MFVSSVWANVRKVQIGYVHDCILPAHDYPPCLERKISLKATSMQNRRVIFCVSSCVRGKER